MSLFSRTVSCGHYLRRPPAVEQKPQGSVNDRHLAVAELRKLFTDTLYNHLYKRVTRFGY